MRMATEKEKLAESMGFDLGALPQSPIPSILQINRPLYQQDDLHDATLYQKPHKSWRNSVRNGLRCNPLVFLLQTIPVLQWLPKYQWRENILYDILSGITVAIMHIPQGMAYGLLGNVPPVVGIYMAFFPVLVYFLFGTSKHISIGTFAIVCLMTGKVVSTHGSDEILQNGTVIRMPIVGDGPSYSNIEVAITVTFTVAIIMFIMYSFRLGIVANLLSETLVNGFTCACAFHVVASQMKDLFGLPVKKRRGMFGMILSIYDAILALPEANRSAVSISLVVIVITVINNEILKPRLAKKTRIPFPIELVAVVLGTAVSYFLDFNSNYNISIVGEIPTGMPAVTLPVFHLMPNIIFECVIIAIVSYAISISMALIFANKSHYDIDANQELFALGCANVVGSFFTCMPIAASLSRSSIQHAVGGVTQIASVVSCALLFLVLLWIGPAFESLPRCVLASIIVVALKSMLTQCLLLPRFWKMSKCDGIIWLVTFLTTTIVSIDIGLGAGIVASLGTLLYRGQAPYTCLLGGLPDTDIYLDVDRYKGVMEVPGVKIFHYCGGLNFASRANFKSLLYKTVGFERTSKTEIDRNGAERLESQSLFAKCIVIDCSALTYVDPAGVEQLRFILDEFKEAGVELFIASCSAPVFETFKRCDKHQKVETHFQIFPCVHDAVMYAKLLHFRLGKDV